MRDFEELLGELKSRLTPRSLAGDSPLLWQRQRLYVSRYDRFLNTYLWPVFVIMAWENFGESMLLSIVAVVITALLLIQIVTFLIDRRREARDWLFFDDRLVTRTARGTETPWSYDALADITVEKAHQDNLMKLYRLEVVRPDGKKWLVGELVPENTAMAIKQKWEDHKLRATTLDRTTP